MTRPIIKGRPFNVVCAPSRSRPQLATDKVRDDLLQAKALMGESGVAGFTEISHAPIKALFRSVFGRRVGLSRSDCPIVWTADFVKVDGGVDRGVRGIPVVAPTRKTVWSDLRRVDGLRVGSISTHMHPGAFAPHPSRAQRLVRPLIRRLWWRHYRRIAVRVEELIAAGCDVVVLMGDINHPGLTTWPHVTRVAGPGLLYIGVTERGIAAISDVVEHDQHADHQAAVVTITPKEKP